MNPNDPFPGFPLTAKESCGEGRGGNSFMIENQADLDFYSKKTTKPYLPAFCPGQGIQYRLVFRQKRCSCGDCSPGAAGSPRGRGDDEPHRVGP